MNAEHWEILAWLLLIFASMLTVAIMWYQIRIK